MAKTGVIYGINGPSLGDSGFQMNEMVLWPGRKLVGESSD